MDIGRGIAGWLVNVGEFEAIRSPQPRWRRGRPSRGTRRVQAYGSRPGSPHHRGGSPTGEVRGPHPGGGRALPESGRFVPPVAGGHGRPIVRGGVPFPGPAGHPGWRGGRQALGGAGHRDGERLSGASGDLNAERNDRVGIWPGLSPAPTGPVRGGGAGGWDADPPSPAGGRGWTGNRPYRCGRMP